MRQKLQNVKILNPVFFIAALICLCIMAYLNSETTYFAMSPKNILHSLKKLNLEDTYSEERHLIGFLINTPGCKIPYMDPFDKSVKKFIEEPKQVKCNHGVTPLFESYDDSIALNMSTLEAYNIDDIEQLYCCYQTFERVPPKGRNTDDNKIIFSDECFEIGFDNQPITAEFIQVSCVYNNETIYKDLFSFVPTKNISKANKNKSLNVLVIGLDAVSRLNFHRQMPDTAAYLQSIGTVELLGYNKVGDNTFPNLIPVLTGMSEGELRNSCWTHDKDRFDRCPFVWKKYKERGFATAFGEDASWMGIFNYQRYGFHDQPTDYAYGYFNRIAEKRIGNSHNMNVFECEGGREVYKDLLDYIKRFVRKMDREKLRYFGFFWGSSLSHDYLNKPHLGDQFYKQFFQNLKDEGHLERTALIFISDHGIRWGDIRTTFQGRMEERLPFVMMTLPSWYKTEYSEAYNNLLVNVRRLTTPFDLHETLEDLADLEHFITDSRSSEQANRSFSLFSKIPKTRTCNDAAISSHWCTCQQSVEIETTNSTVLEVATFAVENINNQLLGYAECATLKLKSIENSRMMIHGDEDLTNEDFTDYMITIITEPGDAIFEVTVRRKGTQEFEVIGTISRLNLYGKQSLCITDFHLKLYCFCK